MQCICTNILVLTSTLTLKLALSDVISCWGKLPFCSTVSASVLQNASLRAGSLSFNNCVLIKAYGLTFMPWTILRKEEGESPRLLCCGEHFSFSSNYCLTLIKFIFITTVFTLPFHPLFTLWHCIYTVFL